MYHNRACLYFNRIMYTVRKLKGVLRCNSDDVLYNLTKVLVDTVNNLGLDRWETGPGILLQERAWE